MSRSERTRGLVSKAQDQAIALGNHLGRWPKDSVDSLHEALQACALALRLDINETLPINGLPPEVLSHTFELACSPLSAAAMAFAVALTHVCRYWRVVLLSNPKIWTNIFARRDSIDFFSECLLRSRTLPIHLNLHYHMGWGKSSCLCEDHVSLVSCGVRCPHIRTNRTTELFTYGPRERLRSLDLLIFFPDPMTPSLERFDEVKGTRFFSRPLLELQSLRLVCLDVDRSWEVFSIYDDIFSRSLPKLKHLSLVHCWGGLTGWVTGLTSFHLEFRNLWEVRSAAFVTFLERNCGTLEVLSLENIEFGDYRGSPVTLTNLKKLELKRVSHHANASLHFTLPSFESLTALRVRFSDGMAIFSATNTSGAVLRVVESQRDVYSCRTDGLATSWWTQISTLDLDFHGSQGVLDYDIEELYCSIPSLETLEIHTVSRLQGIFRPFLPIKHVLHPSLKLLRLPVPREAQDEVFAVLTTISSGRKALGCVTWSIEYICSESCEEVSNQWAIYCEKNGFDNPGIAKFMMDPGFLDPQRATYEGQSAGAISVPEASTLKNPTMEGRERVLASWENLASQAMGLTKLCESHHTRENLSRISEHVDNMTIGIGRIQNEMSPIHKLPRDFLGEVFHHACWSDKHKAPRAAVALSHVCCQWRDILLSTPQFWCGVTVDGRDHSFAAACLARSNNLPLDVTVQFNYTAIPSEDDEDDEDSESGFNVLETEDVRWRLDECREGLTLLVAERDRIHRLYVNYIILGSDWIDSDSLPDHDFFRSPLRNLQELWWYYYDEQGGWSLPIQRFGGSLEFLRHLRLENVEMPMGCIRILTALECVGDEDSDDAPEFFSRNVSLQTLDIFGSRIAEEATTFRIYMDNLTSLTLGVPKWYLLLDTLQVKNFHRDTFNKITLSGTNDDLKFTATHPIGFSLTAPLAPYGDPREDDFIRQHFSGADLVRLEDFQVIFNKERLFSILRVLGDSGGDMRRLELHQDTEFLDTDVEVRVFAEPFLPRLGTLAVYLADWVEPEGWAELMVEDLLLPGDRHARIPDECGVEVYDFDLGVVLSTSMGELRVESGDGGPSESGSQ